MPERRPFLTRTRLGLALWTTTMMLLVVIPQKSWSSFDLWARILVMVPAMAAIGLFLFDEAKRPPRDPKLIFDRRTLRQDLEVIFVTVVVAGIVWWKFKLGI
jgi:hypothetical protein